MQEKVKRFRILLLLSVAVVLIAGRQTHCELLGPGTYHGYFDVTRWAHKVFHLGPYHLFVSDQAAQMLEKHRGKPLELKVSKLSQPANPGAGRIEEIERISVKGFARGLILSAKADPRQVPQGKGISLHLSLMNKSDEAITMWPRTLAVALVTDSPFSNKDIGYKDPDGCAYWYYHYGYHRLGEGQKSLEVACHRIILPWKAEDLVGKGHNIHVADKHRGYSGPVVIEPGGRFEADYVAGKELLPDDYEVFFYLSTGNLSSVPGPMSERIAFDVIRSTEKRGSAR